MKHNTLFSIILISFILLSCQQKEIVSDNVDDIIEEPLTLINRPEELKYIYNIDDMPEIILTVSTAEWNNLLQYFDKNRYNEEYVKGDFLFVKNGTEEALSNIGLRIRGNTSRRRPEGYQGQLHNANNPDWHHASFTVSFKKYDKNQTFHKTEKINLKWFNEDPMYVREVYCYDLFERFGVWTAPKSSYCKLNIKIAEDSKTAYFGIYQIIEPIDEVYITHRKDLFGDDSGNLWKGNYGAGMRYVNKNEMGVENITLTSTYSPIYDLKTNKKQLESAKDQLADFITNINSKNGDNLKSWLETKMDVDLFLKTYAVNVICGMWDDYWGNSNNFYFYFNSSGKFFFIPYDYDNTLGTSYLILDSGAQDPLNWGKFENPLVRRILSIREFKEKYISYLRELNSPKKDLFHHTKSTKRIIKWQNLTKNFIANDTGEDMMIEDKPASWGNCPHYRLLDTSNNYFVVKGNYIP